MLKVKAIEINFFVIIKVIYIYRGDAISLVMPISL